MFNRAKLKGRIYEKYGNLTNFAEALSSPVSGVSMIINGKREPTTATIIAWAEALEIDSSEIGVYFFSPNSPQS